jgi:hypothetical protein
MVEDAPKQTLAEILAQDVPMEILKPPAKRDAAGGGGGRRYGEKEAVAASGSWADALADFRSESAAAETARIAQMREVLEEEESFFELGDGSNFVAFGEGDAANDDEWDEDDIPVDESFEEEALESALDRRYREGQATGRGGVRPGRGAGRGLGRWNDP